MTSRSAFGLALLTLTLATACPAADLLFGQPCGAGLADCPAGQFCDLSSDLCRSLGDGDGCGDGAGQACAADAGQTDAGAMEDGGSPSLEIRLTGELVPGTEASSSADGRLILHGALSPSVTPQQSAGGTYTLKHLELAQP